MHVCTLLLVLSLAASAHADATSGTPEGTFTVATVAELEDQLLSTTNLDTDSLVQVYTNVDAMLGDFSSEAAAPLENANTTAFASVLVMPNPTTGSDTGDEPVGRTQLYYNCTSAPFIWNLLDDTNVVELVDFQSYLQEDPPPGPGRGSSSSSSDGTTGNVSGARSSLDSSGSGSSSGGGAGDLDVPTTVVATATLAIANCNLQRNYSAQQILLGNAFFGEKFRNATTYFRVVTSPQVETAAGERGECDVHLELARAELQDIYPDCQIKFHSTDLGALLSSKNAVVTRTGSSRMVTPEAATTWSELVWFYQALELLL